MKIFRLRILATEHRTLQTGTKHYVLFVEMIVCWFV